MPSTARRFRSLVMAALVTFVPGCGGTVQPPPDSTTLVGTVNLPAGSPLALSALGVSTPADLTGVTAAGTFEVEALFPGWGLMSVTNDEGEAVLLGFADTTSTSNELSARSTAVALLYVALGASGASGVATADIVAYLAALPELPALTAGVAEVLANDPLAIANGSEALLALVREARDAIIARESGSQLAGSSPTPRASGAPATFGAGGLVFPLAIDGNSGVLISDPGMRGGFELVAGEEPFSIAVINEARRAGALYLYQTGLGGSDGSWFYEYPQPLPQGAPTPLLPATGAEAAVGIANAVGLGGDSSLTPSVTPSIVLEKATETDRTFYVAVVIGATSDTTISGDIVIDPKYGQFIAGWGSTYTDLVWQTYWTQMLYPVFRLVLFGSSGSDGFSFAALAGRTAQARTASQPFMQALGLDNPLVSPWPLLQGTLVAAVLPPPDDQLFQTLMEISVGSTGPLNLSPQQLARLKGNAATTTAKAIVALMSESYSSAGIGAAVNDVQNNPSLMVWHPSRLTQAMEIYPAPGELMRLTKVSEVFTLTFDRAFIDYQFIFRWSTSGEYGFLDTPGTTSVDTKSAEIQYLANDPVNISEELRDTIRVEAYLDDGSGAISAATPLMGVASTEVVGVERESHYRGRYEIVEQAYESPPGTARYCMFMYWVFERRSGAKSYEVRAFNYYDHATGSTSTNLGIFDEQVLVSVPGLDETPGSCGVSSWPYAVVDDEVWIPWTGGNGPSPGDAGYIHSRFRGAIVEVKVTY